MNRGRTIAILAIVALAALLLTPFFGRTALPLASLWPPGNGTAEGRIFWDIRVPRAIAGFLAGMALAASGMAFQAMFRNALATPFTLGVSSGASLGAALCVRLGLGVAVLGIPSTSVAAFLGALLAVAVVYGLTQARRGFSTATLLLAGVAISFFFSSLILLIQYTSDIVDSFHIVHWLMGGLAVVGFDPVFNLLPFIVVGVVVVLSLMNELNLLATGEDIATSRGVAVTRVKHALFFATSIMVGAVVAVCGPIGFVGMMSPHICRLLVGADHRWLTPATVLFGGAFLVVCDTAARTILPTGEIPVGVVTALLGGPFFLWLLIGGSSERGVA